MSELIKKDLEAKEAKADKEKADEKKSKKPGFMARISKWFKEMRSELKKVQWPSWPGTMKNTGTVILAVIVVGAFISIFDLLANGVIQALINLFHG